MQWYKRLSRDKDKLYKNSPSSSSASPSSHKHKHKHNTSIPQTSTSAHSTASYAGTVGSIATFGSIPSPTSPLPPSTIPPRTSSQNAPLLSANLPIPNLPSSSSYKLAQVPEAISPFSGSSPSSSSSLSFTAADTGGRGIGSGRIRSRSQSLSYTHSRSHSYTSHSHSHSHSHSRPVAPATIVISSSPTIMSPPPPPPDPSRYATEDLDFIGKKSWNPDKEKVVCGPYDYLFGHPGKDFRSQLIKAFDVWLDVPPESLVIITQVVGMLHTASLLIDDVEDSSSLRRGLPVAHNIFGVAQTINSANYIYFRALQEVQRLRSPTAITVFADELLHLHRGQGMDLFWRDSLTCPSEEDYLEMVGNKTGGLFRLGIKLMQAESRTLIDCVPLVNLVGLIFQIRDDYMNLSSTEYSDNKGLCEDLTEGKFSFPIIHAIRADPVNTQLINILRQKTSDVDVKRYAVAHLEAMGSFAYTRKVVNILIERARKVAMDVDEGRGKVGRILAILDMMILPEVEVGSQSESNTETEGDRKEKLKSRSGDEREKDTPGAIKALQALAMQQEHQKASLDRISRGV